MQYTGVLQKFNERPQLLEALNDNELKQLANAIEKGVYGEASMGERTQIKRRHPAIYKALAWHHEESSRSPVSIFLEELGSQAETREQRDEIQQRDRIQFYRDQLRGMGFPGSLTEVQRDVEATFPALRSLTARSYLSQLPEWPRIQELVAAAQAEIERRREKHLAELKKTQERLDRLNQMGLKADDEQAGDPGTEAR